jgi:hypothetical protein
MLEAFKVALPAAGLGYDLQKLTKEQYLMFRNVFVENCMYHTVY